MEALWRDEMLQDRFADGSLLSCQPMFQSYAYPTWVGDLAASLSCAVHRPSLIRAMRRGYGTFFYLTALPRFLVLILESISPLFILWIGWPLSTLLIPPAPSC